MEKRTEHDYVSEIVRQINYAARSFDLKQMYKAFGYLNACRDCGAISASSYVSLGSTICSDWLNNTRWKNECDLYNPNTCGKRKAIRQAILNEKGIE